MLDVIVNSNEITDLISRLYGAAEADAPLVIATAASDRTKAHLKGVSSKRHRAGSIRDYYADAAESVEPQVDGRTAAIEISHTGFALRYYGGTVRPSGRISAVTGRPIKRLAIPIKGSEAERGGKHPGDFDDMFFIKGRKQGTGFLAGKKSNGMIGLLFGLYVKTEHKADKSILPTTAEYNDAAVEALEQLLEEQDI